jgi:DNA-binding MarR family transcriptional regulator
MVRGRSSSVKAPSGAEIDAREVDVLFLVWLLSRATESRVNAALAELGLTGDEFAVYSMLATGPQSPTELARWMSAPATTVSSYVKRFETRGHVVRAPNPPDRRSYLVRLTASGRRAHRRAATRYRPVSEDVETLLAEHAPAVRDSILRLQAALGNGQPPA